MISNNKIGLSRHNIDWITILIYVTLVLMGWVSIYAAVWDDEGRSAFDLTQRYGMQMVWIGISWFAALVITLSNSKYYHMFSYPFYYVILAIMIGVILVGTEVNGAKSWINIGGGVRIQPVEFMKIATALALARFMSSYNFNIRNVKSLYYIGLIIMTPIMVILMQNDTGSAMVFGAFFIMLYREGFGKELYILLGILILLFLLSFLLEPLTILVAMLIGSIATYAIKQKDIPLAIRYIGTVATITILLLAANIIFNFHTTYYHLTLLAVILSLPLVALYTIRTHKHTIWIYIGLFFGAVLFTTVIEYAFENILQIHQQKRILDMLGLENDPKGWSYNVIQSKIAIGSGGLWGKGFLEGTQTKFSFVPEQSTDFIFCTIGEEWGFFGTTIVITLFTILIYRLMKMGERHKEPFRRVYCYSVAAILFLHFFINIAMTIGLFPVVGIPLPFFSYGGSSLLAFTILLFIAIRLDSTQLNE